MDHEREIADLRAGTEELEQRIQDVRADWERKRRDPRVPGAPAPGHDPDAADGGAVAGDWQGEGPATTRTPPTAGRSPASGPLSGAASLNDPTRLAAGRGTARSAPA